jgi:hypothetical protein
MVMADLLIGISIFLFLLSGGLVLWVLFGLNEPGVPGGEDM